MADKPPEVKKEEKPPEIPKKERKKGEPHSNLPPSPGSLKKEGSARVAVLSNWKEQYERGILHRCKEEGCYYPLKHVTNNVGQNKVTQGGRFVMKCTWDESHGEGEQLVDPPKKKDELGDGDL